MRLVSQLKRRRCPANITVRYTSIIESSFYTALSAMQAVLFINMLVELKRASAVIILRSKKSAGNCARNGGTRRRLGLSSDLLGIPR